MMWADCTTFCDHPLCFNSYKPLCEKIVEALGKNNYRSTIPPPWLNMVGKFHGFHERLALAAVRQWAQ